MSAATAAAAASTSLPPNPDQQSVPPNPATHHTQTYAPKYHSEHEHSSSSRVVANGPSSGVHPPPPPSSPSPPPTAACPHLATRLNLNLIRQRFRTRTFQKCLAEDTFECSDCGVHYPRERLWACLECENLDCCRCGRHDQRHSHEHATKRNHALAIHCTTRVIWCYACDAEVPDDYDAPANAITPQLVRSALDPRDAEREVEQHTARGNGASDGEETDGETGDESEGEEDFMTRLDRWRAFYRNEAGGVVGLSNLGNTCYMGSSLQALLHCPPLIAFYTSLLPSEERQRVAMRTVTTASQGRNQELRLRLEDEFSTLMQKVWSGRYSLCVPIDLLRCVLQLNPYFRGYGQHDAQEFIRCMLDSLHEGSKRKVEYQYDLKKKVEEDRQEEEERAEKAEAEAVAAAAATNHAQANGGSASNPAPSPSKSPSPAPQRKRYPECSLISDLFEGSLVSSIECINCHAVSWTRDPFYDLSLEIPKEAQLKKIGNERGAEALTPQTNKGIFSSIGSFLGLTSPALSLETCLHSFCTSDHLLHHDQYRCDSCKEKVDAVKQLSLGTVDALPEVLTLHIKRFSHNYYSSKISRHVTFPLYNLDMKPFLTQQNKQRQQNKQKTKNSKKDKQTKRNKSESASVLSSPPPSSSPTPPSSSSSSTSTLYDLFALVRHLGSVSGGHYIAYAKSHVTGQWYEFDDKIVSPIDEEKVAKMEAYILFYARKHPTEPIQRLIKQVEAVTVQTNAAANANSASNTARSTPASPSASSPSSASNRSNICYISRYWLKKVEVLGRPEPIDNRDLCCEHGMPLPIPHNGGSRAITVSRSGWDRLFAEYGGGPIVDTCSGGHCEPCELPFIRRQEKARIQRVDEIASRQSTDDPFYLIHSPWLQQWRAFVMTGGPRPGPITNHLLLQPDGATVLPNLKRGEHYRALHGLVWQELWQIYGGGPVIRRPTLDIYGANQQQQQQHQHAQNHEPQHPANQQRTSTVQQQQQQQQPQSNDDARMSDDESTEELSHHQQTSGNSDNNHTHHMDDQPHHAHQTINGPPNKDPSSNLHSASHTLPTSAAQPSSYTYR